ncbi:MULTISPECIES: DUF2750 domain-containing protein [unclassified Shewanella]|uniref:DUF2750 domain-containing protein n=1 Tax=unclassified Shewanella TaxID=196818 RepID=UPI000970A54F|nr:MULTISPECIES: DUF2750 domain-containing protein [unclassified Shewanella]MDO6618843.1 DUF2750 domain-containing protein [Shewanella sp. 6_MG-2023]MDO6640396.1 DUF2750 domain-containing protein [Shewanella sp. 5_MG-2023]MDO6677858.1 DUF2750 domain-containing protein [Shewanella sp. 4_MG-2023]MDO6775235.1 DUF2750 domain-containing protein [Shewanella sp. 3_MG-2023]PMG29680.1 hypothetical protein BCU94_02685 [Shewanella sp. 10N.286.52.C2]
MIELTPAVVSFIENVKKHQVLWGLADETGEGWVVCDSSEFEQTDVMPLWSTQAAAASHCTEEWADYVAVEISVNDFLEFWVGDLNEDGVLIGLDWVANEECLEVDPIELAKELVDIEAE